MFAVRAPLLWSVGETGWPVSAYIPVFGLVEAKGELRAGLKKGNFMENGMSAAKLGRVRLLSEPTMPLSVMEIIDEYHHLMGALRNSP
jgi:hypothetical protein